MGKSNKSILIIKENKCIKLTWARKEEKIKLLIKIL